jgi:gluconolactonase
MHDAQLTLIPKISDAANKRVLSVQGADVSTFCTDERMLQPNDLAVSVLRPTLIYLSGQNYSADTTAGASGDLWTCDGGITTPFPAELLAGADIHRTNGIETSPCGQFLYLSSATNVAGAVVANRIIRFTINTDTGALVEEQPTVFFDFTGDGAAVDIDGMRTDVEGNLFVTRNGKGQVFEISPKGQLLMVINLPGMGGPSNLEFGGAEGKTLFAIGKCVANATAGCAVSFEAASVGKAFMSLQ